MIFFEKKSKKLFFFEKLFCARFEGAGGTGGGDGGRVRDSAMF
jgi:hypothetical protein